MRGAQASDRITLLLRQRGCPAFDREGSGCRFHCMPIRASPIPSRPIHSMIPRRPIHSTDHGFAISPATPVLRAWARSIGSAAGFGEKMPPLLCAGFRQHGVSLGIRERFTLVRTRLLRRTHGPVIAEDLASDPFLALQPRDDLSPMISL
jgi:hypothetical protein